jgi:hypothetical protein
MPSSVLKGVFYLIFFLSYSATVAWSVRQQYKHFRSNRLLEMAYYVTTFYLSSMHSSARLGQGVVYVLDISTNWCVVTLLLPDALLFSICSMLTYCWQHLYRVIVIWTLDDSSRIHQHCVAWAYLVANLVVVVAYVCLIFVLFFAFEVRDAVW